MTDEEINRKFDVVAGHLANLAISQEKSERRMDRLERVVKGVIRAGLRERRETREKINALVDAHVRTEAALARMAEAQTEMAQAQTHTDKRLDALIDIVKEGRNGKNGDHE
jgi:hypothetical protein